MLARNPGTAHRVSALKSGLLDQPGRRDFSVLLKRGITRNGEPFRGGPPLLQLVLLFRQHRVLEERSGAAAIGIALDNQHPFARANLADGVSRLYQGARSRPALKVSLQIRVLEMRKAARSQRVCNSQDDETSALAGVENA